MAETPEHDSLEQSGGGCLLRLSWLIAGNAVLLLAARSIAIGGGLLLTWADAVFWLAAGAMLAARYVDVTRFGGCTASGKPATLAHWRRYALLLCGGALAVWIVAHAIACFWH